MYRRAHQVSEGVACGDRIGFAGGEPFVPRVLGKDGWIEAKFVRRKEML